MLQDNVREAIQALTEILTPNASGIITFGVQEEALRESQINGLKATKNYLEEGGTLGHIVMPGGSGKTRLGIALAYAMYKHDRSSLFVVPSQQALRDFVGKANALGLFKENDVGAVYEGEKRIGKLTFITYASLMRRILGDEAAAEVREQGEADHLDAKEHNEVPPPEEIRIDPKEFDLAIWDEAHMYLTANANKLLDRFKEHAINIGLTATPRYYEGKEVADPLGISNFGNKILEVDYETAKKRGEVCDFENILINTGIKTGIELTSPDQEESAQVSGAINRNDRNLIFADLYKNAEITVKRDDKEEKYTLTGEPTIVFGASIDHVHDMADAINAALTPALKNDKVFRDRLRDKGINPDDPDLVIAAPIHTGPSPTRDDVKGMSLKERNALTDRYHNRKVLMLCATSVLQQSFDSPMTSVVIDSVPRQTYVGVGQAGMRATRSGKKMAFIFNTQDADHPSLTFQDFQYCRGSEEGVKVEVENRNTQDKERATTPTADENASVADYSLTYGEQLSKIAERRRTQRPALFLDDPVHRHFTAFGYYHLDKLLRGIAKSDQKSTNQFIQDIQPWIEMTSKRIMSQTFRNKPIDDHALQDMINRTLLGARFEEAPEIKGLISMVESGNIPGWSNFSQRFQVGIRHNLETLANQKEKNKNTETPLTRNMKRNMLSKTDDSAMIFEKKENSGSITDDDLQSAMDRVLNSLTYREREILKLLFETGCSRKEVGEVFKITGSRVRQIEDKAIRKLQGSARSKYLERFVNRPNEDDEIQYQSNETAELSLDDLPPHTTPLLKHTLGIKAKTSEKWTSNIILSPIASLSEEIIGQKRIIRSYLLDKNKELNYANMSKLTGIDEAIIKDILDTTKSSFLASSEEIKKLANVCNSLYDKSIIVSAAERLGDLAQEKLEAIRQNHGIDTSHR